jgi:superfamily II DNA helicase RecQ
LSIERTLIVEGWNSFWSICVDYSPRGTNQTSSNPNLTRSRVDYKAILPAEEFAVFSRLRDLRKQLAQRESVPLYALFSNEQLALMVHRLIPHLVPHARLRGLCQSLADFGLLLA